MRLALLLVALLLVPEARAQDRSARLNPQAPTWEFTNGLWYDGSGGFTSGTRYAVDGVFTDQRPARIDRTLDLGGGYVVPPFGDAHTHMLSSAYSVSIAEQYEREGIFYVQVLTDRYSQAAPVLGQFATPETIDVAYAHGGISSTGSHPAQIYEMLHLGLLGDLTDAQREAIAEGTAAEDDAYWNMDTLEDLAAKWPRFLEHEPDVVKVYLLDAQRLDGKTPTHPITRRPMGHGLTPPVLREAVRLAHAAGLPVYAHVETAADVALALEAGVDGFAHMPYDYQFAQDARSRLTPQTIALAGERQTVFVPTVGLTGNDYPGRPAGLALARQHQKDVLRALHAAGARIALGADQWGLTSAWEAAYLHEHGYFDDATLLHLWAVHTPQAVFPNRAIGALQDGFEASFLVLACDPTADFACTGQITRRVKQGLLLDEPLSRTAPASGAPPPELPEAPLR